MMMLIIIIAKKWSTLLLMSLYSQIHVYHKSVALRDFASFIARKIDSTIIYILINLYTILLYSTLPYGSMDLQLYMVLWLCGSKALPLLTAL